MLREPRPGCARTSSGLTETRPGGACSGHRAGAELLVVGAAGRGALFVVERLVVALVEELLIGVMLVVERLMVTPLAVELLVVELLVAELLVGELLVVEPPVVLCCSSWSGWSSYCSSRSCWSWRCSSWSCRSSRCSSWGCWSARFPGAQKRFLIAKSDLRRDGLQDVAASRHGAARRRGVVVQDGAR